ncbi:glycosyltransferase [Metabacillus herbersteinensis]|uniref:4,4'-diaponeurosporenoate glycosyltransferase n=2 Tax=Metabacillus herbersteinensis TaxID=283816 RepID=A0ABV6GAW8_9BACI
MYVIMVGLLVGIGLVWYIPTLNKYPHRELIDRLQEVSIIIPARNEEKNLEQLLPSILRQNEKIKEILVVNDDSTDLTREIAIKYGATIIDTPTLPKEWLGKSWACWTGAQQAKGELLLFLDADVTLEKNGLVRLVDAFDRQYERGILSIHPFHKIEHWYESLSALFHLVVFASIGAFQVFSSQMKSNGGFGQVLLCKKRDYEAWGGHERIKQEVVENMAFAQHVSEQGELVRCMSGKGAVSMRMYPDGFQSLVDGWSKSFASGANLTHRSFLLLIGIWMIALFSFISKVGTLLTQEWWIYCALYLVAALLLYLDLRRIGTFRFLDTLIFPVHLVFFLYVFVKSLHRTFFQNRVVWKGRDITIHATQEGKADD